MRIPLDYYRILGVPREVTDEQLGQAYHDRRLQLPRREYSELAVAARRQLLERAYNILANPEKRTEYEQKLAGQPENGESQPPVTLLPLRTADPSKSAEEWQVPTIDIRPEQLAGALLLLQELGEYEQLIRWGESYLNYPQTLNLPPEREQSVQDLRADVVLALSLAYLEMSLEQWQAGEYERAATSGRQGLELLRQESLFPQVQAEIQAELDKLRPYQILELVALSEEKKEERQKGMQLLREMLQARQGIEGKGNDCSGLGIDDFLRFIQQVRLYLTATEQQQLFSEEAQRPSPAATYLAAYASLARGFAQKQPQLIVDANQWFECLGNRQDVHLERAVCALLLGETAAATQALEQSQEAETLALIREQSLDSPDLIPGLCWYGEKWLQVEVLAHFRDLAHQQVSLEDYFADEGVQAYLEQLSLAEEAAVGETAIETKEIETKEEEGTMAAQKKWENYGSWRSKRAGSRKARARTRVAHAEPQLVAKVAGGGGTAVTVPIVPPPQTDSRPFQEREAEKEPAKKASEQILVTATYQQPTLQPPRRQRKRRRKRGYSIKWHRLLPSLALLLGCGALGWWLVKSWQASRSPLEALEGEQLLLQLNEPPIALPPADAVAVAPGTLTAAEAAEAIQAWLSSKSQAFGQQHQVEQLAGILAEPLLANWQQRAENEKRSQSYWQYQHEMQVQSVKNLAPNRALAEAEVREIASYYQNGKLNSSRSYDEKLRVRYTLTLQDERWLLQDIRILN